MHDLQRQSSKGRQCVTEFTSGRSRLIRLPEVMDRIPLSRTSIYNRINDGTFPKPIKLGSKSVAWLESSIDEWIASHVEFSEAEEVQS